MINSFQVNHHASHHLPVSTVPTEFNKSPNWFSKLFQNSSFLKSESRVCTYVMHHSNLTSVWILPEHPCLQSHVITGKTRKHQIYKLFHSGLQSPRRPVYFHSTTSLERFPLPRKSFWRQLWLFVYIPSSPPNFLWNHFTFYLIHTFCRDLFHEPAITTFIHITKRDK